MTAPGETRVRAFADADGPAVVRLWREVFGDDRAPQRSPEAVVARRSREQRDLFLVATTADGTLVGATLAGYDGHRGWLYRVAVDPSHRRRGVGRALVTEAERLLRARGCPKLNLQIEDANDAVVGFYERLGFVVEPRISMGKRLQ